jgi:hypothetical protein
LQATAPVHRELLAVDGTRIKAFNNNDCNFMRASLAEFIKLADDKLDDNRATPPSNPPVGTGQESGGEIRCGPRAARAL